MQEGNRVNALSREVIIHKKSSGIVPSSCERKKGSFNTSQVRWLMMIAWFVALTILYWWWWMATSYNTEFPRWAGITTTVVPRVQQQQHRERNVAGYKVPGSNRDLWLWGLWRLVVGQENTGLMPSLFNDLSKSRPPLTPVNSFSTASSSTTSRRLCSMYQCPIIPSSPPECIALDAFQQVRRGQVNRMSGSRFIEKFPLLADRR